MSGHITGQQARELLAEFNNPRTAIGHIRVRPLLEQLAWTYGAEGHDGEFEWRRWPLGGLWSVGLRDGQISIGPEGGGLGFRTPEDAEEAARALLAAAEEARR